MTPEAKSTPYRATAFADSKPELAEPGPTPERLAHLKEHGFVIITDFVESPWIPILREAGRRVTDACAPENGYMYFTREIKKFVRTHGKGVSFANSAVKRSAWEAIRFDPMPLGEDFQFQTKLAGLGLKAAFPDDTAVLHHHDYDLRGLYARCMNEGLALRMLGAGYNEWDLFCDLAGPRKYVQWLREFRRGNLKNSAAVLFPVLRPWAVYVGSRWGGDGEA